MKINIVQINTKTGNVQENLQKVFDELEKPAKREQLENSCCATGIDLSDLEYMDDDERDSFLFDNDLDPDDFDF